MTPDWLEDLFTHYNSGARNVFCLYGNTSDIFPSKKTDKYQTVSLKDYLLERTGKIEVILHVDPASGIKIEKGAHELEGLTNHSNLHSEDPEQILEQVHEFLLYLANLPRYVSTIVILTNAEYLVGRPNSSRGTLLLKRWAEDPHFTQGRPLIVLFSESLQCLHEIIQKTQRIEKIEIPLPTQENIFNFLTNRKDEFPYAFEDIKERLEAMSRVMVGSHLQSLDTLIRLGNYRKEPLAFADLEKYKQKLVEQQSRGLIAFLSTKTTLDALVGEHNNAIREQFLGDIALWNEGKIQLVPNGYLLVGPPGTGKTFFVQSLSGSAGIPVIKINNFRGSFQGETEGNLEHIFRLLKSLPRAYVFIDEAEQSLGSRQQSTTDGGVSGRVYSLFAQEMSNRENKGRLCWILATSHPHLLETDLKRPGRIDVKIPLLPCENAQSAEKLLRAIAERNQLQLDGQINFLPELLTPGAATTLIEEVLRRKAKHGKGTDLEILNQLLEFYQPPDAEKMLQLTAEAVRESSSRAFIPKELQDLI